MRASTACKHSISGSISLPSSGFFSPFPHGTSSLSVTQEYLGLEGGPPIFRQDFTCPALLEDHIQALPIRGYHPLWPTFPDSFSFPNYDHWPSPFSLVTTHGVSVDFLSSGYLDISVHRVCLLFRMTLRAGFPHSEICGSKAIRASPQLIAAYYVLHRLSTPRHPPNAL